MARPTKAVKTLKNRSVNKDEALKRMENEEKLKGKSDQIIPPDYLSKKQVIIFNYIVGELRSSGILGNLDIFILTTCSIAIERLQYIEAKINKKLAEMQNKELMAAKEKYTKDFFRAINELSLSPQARAKLSNINLNTEKEKEDPLLKVLKRV